MAPNSARLVSLRGKLLLRSDHRFNSTNTSNKAERAKKKLKERRFFESVLGTSTTKREAKSFLSRFDNPVGGNEITRSVKISIKPEQPTVNLGTLYTPYRALENTPLFSQYPIRDKKWAKLDLKTHVAIIKLQDIESYDDSTLEGLGTTFHQLARLGVMSIIVADDKSSIHNVRFLCNRLLDGMHANQEARIIDLAFSENASNTISLDIPKLILSPLQRGIIPIIVPIVYSEDGKIKVTDADRLIVNLTEAFTTKGSVIQQSALLDRIIFINKVGGIPDPKNSTRVQSFVNLMSEYRQTHCQLLSNLLDSNTKTENQVTKHLRTIECIQKCLSILPPSASALVSSASEVAASNEQTASYSSSSSITGVGTRPKRNPLIHNILTNKPLVSSSLPAGRFSSDSKHKNQQMSSTVFKRGMPVHIIPDPRLQSWSSPNEYTKAFRLDDAKNIDLAKLKFLIEDSFNRPIDIDAYLNRIHNHLAGVIIAGDYEGGAILTWEETPNRSNRPPVPYLDKFAVLKRCQGAGGVADVLFNAMVRDCFPAGVVWRSRNNNPVNKWYFERSSSALHIPNSPWTMFWTGDGFDSNMSPNEKFSERFKDYIDVCSHIQPNWADQKPPD